MLSSHYHLHKSKTLTQLTQCPFTGTLLLLSYGAVLFVHILFARTPYFDSLNVLSHQRLESKCNIPLKYFLRSAIALIIACLICLCCFYCSIIAVCSSFAFSFLSAISAYLIFLSLALFNSSSTFSLLYLALILYKFFFSFICSSCSFLSNASFFFILSST